MAACDNLYGNRKEWKELHDFLVQNRPKYIEYMRSQPKEEDGEIRICYISDIQGYLFENCPLDWVKERLKDNFSIQKLICGKPHHEKHSCKFSNALFQEILIENEMWIYDGMGEFFGDFQIKFCPCCGIELGDIGLK